MIPTDLLFLVASCASDKAVYLGEIQKTYWNCHSFLFLGNKVKHVKCFVTQHDYLYKIEIFATKVRNFDHWDAITIRKRIFSSLDYICSFAIVENKTESSYSYNESSLATVWYN